MIADNGRRVQYDVSGGYVTDYTIPFKYFSTADILLNLVDEDGVELTIPGGTYSISDPGDTGTLTKTGTWPDGARLTIYRELDYTQDADLENGDDMDAETLEAALDRTVAQVQQLTDTVGRAINTPIGDPVDLVMDLPIAEERAGLLLGFNANGEPIATSGGSGYPISSAMEDVVSAVSHPAALVTLGVKDTAVAPSAAIRAFMEKALTTLASGITYVGGADPLAAIHDAESALWALEQEIQKCRQSQGIVSKSLASVDATLSSSEAKSAVIDLYGSVSLAKTVTIPKTETIYSTTIIKKFAVLNRCTGTVPITIKTSAAGTNKVVVLYPGECAELYTDGTDVWRITPQALSLRGAIDGLTVAQAADTDHDVTVAAGSARDSTNTTNIELRAAITKQIDAAWAAGTAAGGLDTGTVGNTTWYYLFAIKKDSDASVDVLFSTSKTAPSMPSGYTYFRRIGSVRTDGSANILGFSQNGDEFTYKTLIADRAAATLANTSRILTTLTAPPSMKARVHVYAASTTAYYFVVTPIANTDAAPSSVDDSFISPGVATAKFGAELLLSVDASSQIALRGSNTGLTVGIQTIGWFDDRGRNT